jgi:hypothetical protein
VSYIKELISRLSLNFSCRKSATEEAGQKPVTALTGQLADQAPLFGILNGLYNMRLPLLSVEWSDSGKIEAIKKSDFGKLPTESESLP